MRPSIIALVLTLWAAAAAAQPAAYRGFLEGRGFAFPLTTPNDTTRLIGDALFRNEVDLKPADWFQLAAGLDLRANSDNQVENEWRLDLEDRGLRRPRISLRRLAATIGARGFTLDVGKQFIRWGRADIIYPTDRFAPRDYLNVIEPDLLPIIGARAAVQVGSETFEAVWVPQLTPSRLPLIDQRWAPVPPEAGGLVVTNAPSELPAGAQFGGRWRHTGSRLETALSVFDGFNHLPDIALRARSEAGVVDVVTTYPAIRMFGGDVAIPTQWLTLKAEAAYVQSPAATSDDYIVYVVEIERQIGEWLLDIGYAGEVVRRSRVPLVFAPDRSLSQSLIGRAVYSVDPRRRVIIEGAARASGDGVYGKLEYSQAMTDHWRLTLTGVGLAGEPDDFLGQYRRNSHGSLTLRVTF